MSEIRICPFCGEEIKSVAVKCKHCGSALSEVGNTGHFLRDNPDTLIRQALADKYQITGSIGNGGMATVYRAVQVSLGRTVALKVIHPNLVHDNEFVQRFLREAYISASLKHPNIITIYDIGSIGDIHYMSMELLEGNDLHHILRSSKKIGIDKIVQWIAPIAEALDYIHNRGLLHRDVKSANIFITTEGRPVLMDFGIAQASNGTKLTQSGSILGTPEYMSPEQANGKDLTAQSDLWSLGVVLYDCLSGRVPFKGDNPLTTIHLVVNQNPTNLRTLNNLVPGWLSAVVMKLLEKDPNKRYKTGKEVANALRQKKAPATSNPKNHLKADRSESIKGSKHIQPKKIITLSIGLLVIFMLILSAYLLFDFFTGNVQMAENTNENAAHAGVAQVPLTPGQDYDEFDKLYYQAEQMSQSGNFQEALRLYEMALSLDPGNPEIIRRHAETENKFIVQGNNNLQIADAQLLKEEEARQFETSGDKYFLEGKLNDAIKEYEAAIALLPEKASLIYKKQRALDQINNQAANDELIRNAVQEEEEEERIFRENQLAKERELEEINRKRQIDQKINELINEGDEYLKRNNFTQALASYKIASALNPEAQIPKDKIEQTRQLEARQSIQKQTVTANNSSPSAQSLPNNVYTLVEVMPTFPGGNIARVKYLAENLRYPDQAINARIEGTVKVSFIIDEQGKAGFFSVINPLGYGCDEEAVRLLRQMPTWNPGKQQDRFVKVRMEMNIPFNL